MADLLNGEELVEINRGIVDRVRERIVSWTDANLFILLLLKADPVTGIVVTSAPRLALETTVSVHVIRKALPYLRSLDWIRYDSRGLRGGFPVEIVGYPAPECVATWEQRRRRRSSVNRDRLAILERDQYTCQYCGAGPLPPRALHVDHVVPLSRGGQDAEENKITACAHCNLTKSDKMLWAEWIPPHPTDRLIEEHGGLSG